MDLIDLRQLDEATIKEMYDIVDEDKDFSIMEYTVKDFILWCTDENEIVQFADNKGKNLYDKFSVIKSVVNGIKYIFNVIDSYKVQQSSEEIEASRGIEFLTFFENMLVECVEYFHLHNMEEAEKIIIADWFLIKKNKLSQMKYERQYHQITDRKYANSNKR